MISGASAVFLFGSSAVYAQATDTTATDSSSHVVKKKDLSGHQLCIGYNIVRPILNSLSSTKTGYEFAADYYNHNEFYYAGEAGWGSSAVNYTNLSYTTKNEFLSLGFDKSLLARDNVHDWDMMFVGMRLGVANVSRSAANFTIVDSVWGNSDSSAKGQNFVAVWMELTGGMRVELLKGLFAGWNARGRFLLDARSFQDLAPLYIAGYGRGDKDVSFDFNVYVSYAIRWKRKNVISTPSASPVAK